MESIIAIPMYRVSPGKWEKEFEDTLEKSYGDIEGTEEQIEKLKERARNRDYYHWKYNDVVGWIELYVDFSKVKARIFMSDKQRYTRGFHPIYKDNYKIAVEVPIRNKDNEEIIRDIREAIHSWKEHYYKNRFHIDYSFLKSIVWTNFIK
jgi:hypothetical protein